MLLVLVLVLRALRQVPSQVRSWALLAPPPRVRSLAPRRALRRQELPLRRPLVPLRVGLPVRGRLRSLAPTPQLPPARRASRVPVLRAQSLDPSRVHNLVLSRVVSLVHGPVPSRVPARPRSRVLEVPARAHRTPPSQVLVAPSRARSRVVALLALPTTRSPRPLVPSALLRVPAVVRQARTICPVRAVAAVLPRAVRAQVDVPAPAAVAVRAAHRSPVLSRAVPAAVQSVRVEDVVRLPQ